MKYEGKIYGKVGGKYIALQENAADIDRLKSQNARLLEALKEALPIVKHFIKNHDFTTIEKMETAISESEK